MCGRYTMYSEAEAIADLLHKVGALDKPLPAMPPQYNIAPTQRAWAITASAHDAHSRLALQLVPMAFGFRPSFMSHGVINARAETVLDKPMFKRALAHDRCLVLASGFYEWATLPKGGKQPHHFALTSQKPFVFAGLCRKTQPGDPGHGTLSQEYVIITTAANGRVAPIHGRMPVMLDANDARTWLQPSAQAPDLVPMLSPFPEQLMTAHPVSSQVNKPSFHTADCIAPVS